MQFHIDDQALEALCRDAAAYGDEEQVELCRRALGGDEEALRMCKEVVDYAAMRAAEDEDDE